MSYALRPYQIERMNWHEYFTYDDATGNLIWKVRPISHFTDEHRQKIVNATRAGTVAGDAANSLHGKFART